MIYLASPYSHPNSEVRKQRYESACQAAAVLMRDGAFVFSPIAHTHGIALYGLPLGWDYWDRYDREMLSACDSVTVLTIDGWDTSKGVAAEIEIAKELGKPVTYWRP